VFEHKTPTGRECYSYRNKLASLGVLQHEMTRHRNRALLVAAPALVLLLGMAAVLGVTLKTAARRAVGLIPEIVCTADRSLMIVNEIVVRAPRPAHLIGVVAHLSGINK
jgi:hypothetical protein